MTTFSQARTSILARIKDSCIQAKRDPNTVRLLAASKRTDAKGIINAIKEGHILFGENRAQSLRDKHNIVSPHYPQAQWHFIGHLQKNKIKYLVGRICMLHSLDSRTLADALNRYLVHHNHSALDVLLQIKFGNEENKTGITSSDFLDMCQHIHASTHLNLKGLMCIPPRYGTPKEWFAQLAELAQKGRSEGFPLHELSMGMSSDLEDAVAQGATIVRVGSALFLPT